ncbi:MAG TPA: flagellar hook protein FlgE [Syntrophorhabdaceae bacterium]|nr:flagellar hook protein FlgE [Syntrophorhabdaceae bacterium]
MLSSFFSGISGLLANSNAINVVSNNIANVNTIGYKASTASFEDVLYQSINGASGTSQVGRGTALSSVDTNFSAGSLETTTQGTDLAIGGKGFFIVKSPASQNIYYTRAGEFRFDSAGNLTDPNGNVLQGRIWDQTTDAPAGVDTDIIISQATSQPKATQQIDMNVNLQSDSTWAGNIGTLTAGTGSPLSAATLTSGGYPRVGTHNISLVGNTLTMTVQPLNPDGTNSGPLITYTGTVAAGTSYTNWQGSGLDITTATGATYTAGGTQTLPLTGFSTAYVSATKNPSTTSNYSSSVTVYDSMGQAHTANIYFRKTSEDVTTGQSVWEWIAELDAADAQPGVNTMEGWGTLTFNSNGNLQSGGTPQGVPFNFSGGVTQNQNIEIVLGQATGGGTTTQYPISSTTSFQTQDGYPPGVLQSTSVSSEGIISGTYSNGQILKLYQLTLANFNNPNGLYKEGSNLYSETLASGVHYTNNPGEGGLGKISPNSLEQSNVDLATEFVKMIISERGFQANSKVITTTDEVLQELMNLKR